jgi:hypothetical protein
VGECRGFQWIGQSLAHCDNCGRDVREHDGLHMATLADPFAPDQGEVVPFLLAMQRVPLFAHAVTRVDGERPYRWELCEAADCPKPPLTAFTDGADESWWLCEEHGDLLAVGFPTRRPRSTSIEPALRQLLGGVTDGTEPPDLPERLATAIREVVLDAVRMTHQRLVGDGPWQDDGVDEDGFDALYTEGANTVLALVAEGTPVVKPPVDDQLLGPLWEVTQDVWAAAPPSALERVVGALLDLGWRPTSIVTALRRRVDELNQRLVDFPCDLPEHADMVPRAALEADSAVLGCRECDRTVTIPAVPVAAGGYALDLTDPAWHGWYFTTDTGWLCPRHAP